MRTLLYISLYGLFTFACFNTMSAQEKHYEKFEKREFISKDGDILLYRIMFPLNYDKTKKYPLVLFLHGAGERGNDNTIQLMHGSKLFTDKKNIKRYPAIVVFPQCTSGKWWSNMVAEENYRWNFVLLEKPVMQMQLVIGMLDYLEKSEAVDKNREYVMGLSMGGMGTFEILCYQPKRFAAAVPICGAHETKYANKYKNIPMWIFHGRIDQVVPAVFSRDIYAKLKQLGANVKYTEYPKVNHNSWDHAFAEPDLLKWIFSNSR